MFTPNEAISGEEEVVPVTAAVVVCWWRQNEHPTADHIAAVAAESALLAKLLLLLAGHATMAPVVDLEFAGVSVLLKIGIRFAHSNSEQLIVTDSGIASITVYILIRGTNQIEHVQS